MTLEMFSVTCEPKHMARHYEFNIHYTTYAMHNTTFETEHTDIITNLIHIT